MDGGEDGGGWFDLVENTALNSSAAAFGCSLSKFSKVSKRFFKWTLHIVPKRKVVHAKQAMKPETAMIL